MIEDQPEPEAAPRSYQVGCNFQNEVLIDFKTPVRYVRLSKKEAQNLAQYILKHAEKLRDT